MITKVFAIKDVKVGFLQPFTQVNEAVAIREFTNMVNADGYVGVNANDMELYCLGSYNQDNGAIESDIRYLVKGVDVKRLEEV